MKVVTDMHEADVPAEATVIDSTTDFLRNKFGPSGDVVDRKTRICARGDYQQAGFDYGEVLTPMAAAGTTRVLSAIAGHHDLHIHQVDVKAAYLNASLKQPVYMHPPRGDPQLQVIVWKVHKAVCMGSPSLAWAGMSCSLANSCGAASHPASQISAFS